MNNFLEFLTIGRWKQVVTVAKVQWFCQSADLDYGYPNGEEI